MNNITGIGRLTKLGSRVLVLVTISAFAISPCALARWGGGGGGYGGGGFSRSGELDGFNRGHFRRILALFGAASEQLQQL